MRCQTCLVLHSSWRPGWSLTSLQIGDYEARRFPFLVNSLNTSKQSAFDTGSSLSTHGVNTNYFGQSFCSASPWLGPGMVCLITQMDFKTTNYGHWSFSNKISATAATCISAETFGCFWTKTLQNTSKKPRGAPSKACQPRLGCAPTIHKPTGHRTSHAVLSREVLGGATTCTLWEWFADDDKDFLFVRGNHFNIAPHRKLCCAICHVCQTPVNLLGSRLHLSSMWTSDSDIPVSGSKTRSSNNVFMRNVSSSTVQIVTSPVNRYALKKMSANKSPWVLKKMYILSR